MAMLLASSTKSWVFARHGHASALQQPPSRPPGKQPILPHLLPTPPCRSMPRNCALVLAPVLASTLALLLWPPRPLPPVDVQTTNALPLITPHLPHHSPVLEALPQPLLEPLYDLGPIKAAAQNPARHWDWLSWHGHKCWYRPRAVTKRQRKKSLRTEGNQDTNTRHLVTFAVRISTTILIKASVHSRSLHVRLHW
jgi:hypothetical protein